MLSEWLISKRLTKFRLLFFVWKKNPGFDKLTNYFKLTKSCTYIFLGTKKKKSIPMKFPIGVTITILLSTVINSGIGLYSIEITEIWPKNFLNKRYNMPKDIKNNKN